MRDDWDGDEDDPTHRSSCSSPSLPRDGVPRPSLNPTAQRYATDKSSFPPPLAQSQPAASSSSRTNDSEVKGTRIDPRENLEEAEKRVDAEV